MPEDPAEPPRDEFERAIRDYIVAGAHEGAMAATRRLMERAQVQLSEVIDTLTALGTKDVTGTGSFGLPAMRATSGGTVVQLPTARVAVTAFPLTVTVSQHEVTAAFEEARSIGESEVEKLSAQRPVKWSRQQLLCVALLVIFDAYLALPSETRQYLMDWGTLIQAVAAVIDLLCR
jgi:hypothetical protein